MFCENIFCIYQEDGKCIFDETTIYIDGMCSECMLVEIDSELLERLKKEKREELDRRYEELCGRKK